jgi:predicted dehydrogenase
MKTVVIGCGRWGRVLFNAAIKVGIGVTGLYDTNRQTIAHILADPYYRDIPYSSDPNGLGDFLDRTGPEAAIIATPPPTHLVLVQECLERGLSVFCEKPLVMSMDELNCIEVPEGQILQVGYQFAYMPVISDFFTRSGSSIIRGLWYNQGPIREDIGGKLNTLVHPASMMVALFWDDWVEIDRVVSFEYTVPGEKQAGACTVAGVLVTGLGLTRYTFDTNWHAHHKRREFAMINCGEEEFIFDDVRKCHITQWSPGHNETQYLSWGLTPVQKELAEFAHAVVDRKASLFPEPQFTRRVFKCLGVE